MGWVEFFAVIVSETAILPSVHAGTYLQYLQYQRRIDGTFFACRYPFLMMTKTMMMVVLLFRSVNTNSVSSQCSIFRSGTVFAVTFTGSVKQEEDPCLIVECMQTDSTRVVDRRKSSGTELTATRLALQTRV